jgi:hypothetical protein
MPATLSVLRLPVPSLNTFVTQGINLTLTVPVYYITVITTIDVCFWKPGRSSAALFQENHVVIHTVVK